MKLAYQTNTWGGVVGHPVGVTSVKDLYYLTPGSNEQALADIAAAGYTGFELFDGNLMQYHGHAADFRALMERTQLQFVAVYSGANFIYQEILEDELSKIEQAAHLAAQFGAEHLVVGGGAVRSRGVQEEDYRRLGAGLERVVAIRRRPGRADPYVRGSHHVCPFEGLQGWAVPAAGRRHTGSGRDPGSAEGDQL